MNNFDYNKHAVIGELSINQSSGNGYVRVLGYIDGSNYIFLSQVDINKIFLPKGEVFAFNIQRDYIDYDKELISLYVIPNEKEGDKYNAYVWDHFRGVYVLGSKTIRIEEKFNDNGEENFSILSKYNFLDQDEPYFFISDDKLYKVDKSSTSRFIPYCIIDDNTEIVDGVYSTYFLENDLPSKDGVIDITTDEQLIDWFINKIARNNWQDIQSGDGSKLICACKEALISLKNLDDKIIRSRLERIKRIVKSFILTRDSLQDILNAKWLHNTVYKSIEAYKDDYISSILSDNAKELDSIKEQHLQEIETAKLEYRKHLVNIQESKDIAQAKHDRMLLQLEEDVANKENELSSLNESVTEKHTELNALTTQLNHITQRKEDILADFEVIKEVLDVVYRDSVMSNQMKDAQTDIQLNKIALTENKLPIYNGFNKNLEICLKNQGCQANRVKEISTLFAAYNILLLPDVETVMAIINATGKCIYATSYVNVSWKSFDDLWSNGLKHVVESCIETPEIMHYLVIRNINLSYLPNYLQPLLDIQAGFTDTFYGTTVQFPSNLKILMTRTCDEVIPLTKDCLRNVGCVSKSDMFAPLPRRNKNNVNIVGYLDIDLINEGVNDLTDDVIINSSDIQYYINE